MVSVAPKLDRSYLHLNLHTWIEDTGFDKDRVFMMQSVKLGRMNHLLSKN